MNILFVQTNTVGQLMPLPIGAAMAAKHLERSGHRVRFLDLMGERDPIATARRVTAEFRPDLACFSIRNRDNQSLMKYHDPLPGIRDVVNAVREVADRSLDTSASAPLRRTTRDDDRFDPHTPHAPHVPILLGGTAFTTFPHRMMDYFGADYGIAGDALAPVSRFVASLENGAPDFDTPGLVYHDEDGRIIANPFQLEGYHEIDTDYHDFIDAKRYRKTYWDAAIITRSGCPENCEYCDTFRTFGREFILRDPDAITEEMLMLKRARGARSVWLVDAGFNRPLDHAKQVLEAIIRRGAQMQLYSVFDPWESDAEFLSLYRQAGGLMFMMSAESLSDPVLETLQKKCRFGDIEREARAIRAAGLDFMLMPALGSPGETRDTVEESLRRAPGLKAVMTDFGIGWRIQPDTPMRARAVREGMINEEDDCWDAHFYLSPETPLNWLRARLRRYRRSHAHLGLRMLPFVWRAMTRRPAA